MTDQETVFSSVQSSSFAKRRRTAKRSINYCDDDDDARSDTVWRCCFPSFECLLCDEWSDLQLTTRTKRVRRSLVTDSDDEFDPSSVTMSDEDDGDENSEDGSIRLHWRKTDVTSARSRKPAASADTATRKRTVRIHSSVAHILLSLPSSTKISWFVVTNVGGGGGGGGENSH